MTHGWIERTLDAIFWGLLMWFWIWKMTQEVYGSGTFAFYGAAAGIGIARLASIFSKGYGRADK